MLFIMPFLLSGIILNAVMLSVVILTVVAPRINKENWKNEQKYFLKNVGKNFFFAFSDKSDILVPWHFVESQFNDTGIGIGWLSQDRICLEVISAFCVPDHLNTIGKIVLNKEMV
jgi:hypothetical protein